VSEYGVNDSQKIRIKRCLPEDLITDPVPLGYLLCPVIVSLSVDDRKMEKGIVGDGQKINQAGKKSDTEQDHIQKDRFLTRIRIFHFLGKRGDFSFFHLDFLILFFYYRKEAGVFGF
jgi:hypothetical protein